MACFQLPKNENTYHTYYVYYYYVWGWIIFTSELQLKVNLFSKIRFHKYTQGEFVFLYDKFVVSGWYLTCTLLDNHCKLGYQK